MEQSDASAMLVCLSVSDINHLCTNLIEVVFPEAGGEEEEKSKEDFFTDHPTPAMKLISCGCLTSMCLCQKELSNCVAGKTKTYHINQEREKSTGEKGHIFLVAIETSLLMIAGSLTANALLKLLICCAAQGKIKPTQHALLILSSSDLKMHHSSFI